MSVLRSAWNVHVQVPTGDKVCFQPKKLPLPFLYVGSVPYDVIVSVDGLVVAWWTRKFGQVCCYLKSNHLRVHEPIHRRL